MMTPQQMTDAHVYGGWTPAEIAESSDWNLEEVNLILEQTVPDELARDAVREMEAVTLMNGIVGAPRLAATG